MKQIMPSLIRSLRSKWRRGIWILFGLMLWQTVSFFSSLIMSPLEIVDPTFVLIHTSSEIEFFPLTNVSEDTWEDTWKETLPNSTSHLWTFSAYYDNRFQPPQVVVFAILKTKERNKVHCQFVTADGTKHDVAASKKVIRENWNLLYSAFRVFCPISEAINNPLVQVALYIPKSDQTPTSFLNIHDRRKEIFKPRQTFATCVKPMHYQYDRAVWLVEFIEFYRLLGVSHFYFYNHTVGPNVQRVLESYQVLGIATVLQWNLPVKSQTEIRTEGMFAALNDCVYRTMYNFNYTVMVDFDEFIIPRKELTYHELLPKLRALKPSAGSFVFQNIFFYLYWDNDTEFLNNKNFSASPDDVPYFITLFKTKRLKQPHRHTIRSKYIVIPEFVKEVGNHNIWEHETGKNSLMVSPNTALSHHYRICEFGGFDCLKKPSIRERTTWRYANDLVRNTLSMCASMFPETGLCPPAPPLGSPW